MQGSVFIFVWFLLLFVCFERLTYLALGCKRLKYLERFFSGWCERQALSYKSCQFSVFSHHGTDNDSPNELSIQQGWPLMPPFRISLWCAGLSDTGPTLDTGLLLTIYHGVFLSNCDCLELRLYGSGRFLQTVHLKLLQLPNSFQFWSVMSTLRKLERAAWHRGRPRLEPSTVCRDELG